MRPPSRLQNGSIKRVEAEAAETMGAGQMEFGDTYRKAAMVIASLDRQAADEVLERLPEQHAAAIRQILVDVPCEVTPQQSEAIREFLEPEPIEGPDDSDPSGGVMSLLDDEVSPTVADAPADKLLRLSDVAIVSLLQHERTSVVAAVLSIMPGARSASLLSQCTPELASRVLNALGSMSVPDSAAMATLLDYLLEQCATQDLAQPRDGRQQGPLQAILANLDDPHRGAMLQDLANKNPMLAARLGQQPAA